MNTYITNIDGEWYAFAGDEKEDKVYSIGADCPPEWTGCYSYTARWTSKGIKYVASSSPSRSAAYQKARRWGTYCGEV